MNQPPSHWAKLAAAGLLVAAALAGCGGGSDGAAGPAGATGPAGAAGAAGATGPAGTNAVATVQIKALSSDQWAALAPKGEVTKVTINGAPVVEFKVTDANGFPVVGLGNTSKSATATVASYPNLAFALAKLVPATASSPSKWVSYLVTTVPSTTAALTATRPSTDANGTLVDNGDGSYKYTFYRDITKTKAVVDGLTLVSPNVAADLGDLSYEPALTHRVVVQISGNAPGTGSNTANGVTVAPAVAMVNPVNLVYDFIPATGKAVTATDTQRELVSKDSCNECHNQIGVTTPHGGRVDTRYCVLCHTDQRKFGYASVASVAGKFPALTETATVNATTGITSYSYSPETRIADGEVSGNFPIFIHKIHNGAELVKSNYNYANIAFNNKGYSMLGGGQKMCSKCHDSAKAAQADNWSSKPSRQACGSCHDGINWATGLGSTLADKAAATAVGAVMATTGHIGKMQTSDATCALCHDAASVKIYHQTENKTAHNPTIAAGLKTFTYDILSATVDATSNDVTIKFKVSADGTPVTYLAPAAAMANPLTGFTGSPSFLLAYATAQDGIAAPIDYNNTGVKQAQAVSVSIANLLDTTRAANGSLSATADANGYYTATLKGTGTWKFPVGAKLRAVGLQGYFTQNALAVGGVAVARHAISVVKAVTGDAVRRTVVDPAKCSSCHEWFEGHGGNRVYQTQVCVMCHTPGLATSGRGISDAALLAYPFSAADVKILGDWKFDKTLPNAALNFPVVTNDFKDMIHGIHAGRERVTPFVDARDRTPSAITLLNFKRMDFPGKLNACETCHVTGTAAATTYNTVPAGALASTYESINAAYAATPTPATAKAALNIANPEDKVTTPFAAACVSCHDSALAQGHMSREGGQIKVSRSAMNLAGEGCALCHGAGTDFDPVKVHK